MKRPVLEGLLALCLMLLCVAIPLAGAPHARAQEETLRVMVWSWSPGLDGAFDAALAGYEESRGVDIDLTRVAEPERYWEHLLKYLETTAPPDVLWMHFDMVPHLATGGHIVEVERFFAGGVEEALDLPAEVLDRFQYKETVYGIPLGAEGEFALNAYAVSTMAEELGKDKRALDLILFLRTRIPPSGPEPPPQPAPSAELSDLALIELNGEVIDEGRLLVFSALVSNTGDARAPETMLRAESQTDSWWAAETFVPELDSGNSAEVLVELEIPEEMRGRSHPFRVELDPSGEIEELTDENNWQDIEVHIQDTPQPEAAPEEPEDAGPDSTAMAIVAAVAGIAVAGVSLTVRHSMTVRRHRELQEQAKEEEPPETCQPCTRHCRKIELEAKPAPREVAYVRLTAARQGSAGDAREGRMEGEIVDRLNSVVGAFRRDGSLQHRQEELAAAATLVVEHVAQWLPQEPSHFDVAIHGHLTGGEVKCQFYLYHCRQRGEIGVWEEEDKWEATIKEESDEAIATLQRFSPTEPDLHTRFVPVVTGGLVHFIQRV